jgi:hypothetical protein
MNHFTPIDPAKSGWNPSHLAYIQDLHWSTYESDSRLRLTALLQPPPEAGKGWPQDRGLWFRAVIEFHGVRNLRMADLGRGPWQIMGFAVDDLRDRGLEGISYHVYDYEDSRLEFHAREMTLISHESDHGEFLHFRNRK